MKFTTYLLLTYLAISPLIWKVARESHRESTGAHHLLNDMVPDYKHHTHWTRLQETSRGVFIFAVFLSDAAARRAPVVWIFAAYEVALAADFKLTYRRTKFREPFAFAGIILLIGQAALNRHIKRRKNAHQTL